jgi:hypothetical protein
MTTDTVAQLAILADALTEIIDLATGGEKKMSAPPGEVLARAGDIAAEALAVASTYRRLPPFASGAETPAEAANFDPPASA